MQAGQFEEVHGGARCPVCKRESKCRIHVVDRRLVQCCHVADDHVTAEDGVYEKRQKTGNVTTYMRSDMAAERRVSWYAPAAATVPPAPPAPAKKNGTGTKSPPVPPPPPPAEASVAASIRKYVACCFEDVDLIEVRRLPSGRSTWHQAADLSGQAAVLLADNGKDDIYVGALPRSIVGDGSKAEVCPGNKCGKCRKCVAYARSVFVDLDECTIDKAQHALGETQLPQPTLIVASGGGTHLYWRLTEPLTDLDRWRRIQQGLIAMFKGAGADPAIHDLPRIMRLPGLLNKDHKKKYGGPRPCRIVECDPKRRWPVEEFETEAAKTEVEVEVEASAEHKPPQVLPDKILDGERNRTIFNLACSLRGKNVSQEAALAACFKENEAKCCNKDGTEALPLPAAEIDGIVRSAYKYKVGEKRSKGRHDRGPSQADDLVTIGLDFELFHGGGGEPTAYATYAEVDGRHATAPIRSTIFKQHLANMYFVKHKKSPGAQAIGDAVLTLCGIAVNKGIEHATAVRIGRLNGTIYLDLVTDRQVVEITAGGWRLVPAIECPIRFLQRNGMLPLPIPTTGGKLDDLRDNILNLSTDDDWLLIVGWLLQCLWPAGPFMILDIDGEAGSGKSFTSRLLRSLVDPSEAPLRRIPRDERDLMLQATNGWILAFDNLSGIPVVMSDALCSLATGGGLSCRRLYTDSEESLFSASRPVLINGVCDTATRSDLSDRCVRIRLPVLKDKYRRREEDLIADFEVIRPGVLGALLTAASRGLRDLGKAPTAGGPRMLDATCWIEACGSAVGWSSGTFTAAYQEDRAAAAESVVESSNIGGLLLKIVRKAECWQGTAAALLEEVDAIATEKQRSLKTWPTSAQAVAAALRRLAPALRGCGIEVTEPGGRTGHSNSRIWRLAAAETQAVLPIGNEEVVQNV